MTEPKLLKYQIHSRVKIGSEYFYPESGETLILELDDEVGQSLVEQGAATLVVERTVKVAEKVAEKDPKPTK